MKLKSIILIAATISCFICSAQSGGKRERTLQPLKTSSMNLKIGDKFPDFEIAQLFNAAQPFKRTVELKDKLLIVDFWATSCSGCVAALPKMQKLQNRFGSRLQILPVTFEGRDWVQRFWTTNKYTKDLTLPTVVEDTLFAHYLGHEYVPHEVWIYKGKVVGITGSEYVDEANIERVLEGQQPGWPVKNDFYFFDGTNESLFAPDKNQIDTGSTLLEYAAVCDYMEKENASAAGPYGSEGVVIDPLKKYVRSYFINKSIVSLYMAAWNKILPADLLIRPTTYSANMMEWDVGDRSKYDFQPDKYRYRADWMRDHGICFESQKKYDGEDEKQLYRNIISDLDQMLGLHVRWERRTKQVLILKVRDSRLLATASSKSRDGNNITLNELANMLNQQADNPYVFNEMRAEGKRMIKVKIGSWTGIDEIRKSIGAYGVDLIAEQRPVDKFVITEVNGGTTVDAQMIGKAVNEKKEREDLPLPDSTQGRLFMEKNKSNKDVIVLPSGLQYKVIRKGTGIAPSIADSVWVHYTGKYINGKIFESTHENGLPAKFLTKDAIPGFQEALTMMKEGAVYDLYIPSKLAYGDHTNYGQLPRNSSLVFEVELMSVVKKGF